MSRREPEQLRFSKKAVNRAGDILVQNPQDEEALGVLEYWRGLHAGILDEEEPETNYKTFSKSERLKRTVSIIEKLKRYPEMQLARMQDIAGVRVVADLREIGLKFEDFFNILRNVLLKNEFRKQKYLHDYITQPKPSGYRAKHLVLSFAGNPYELLCEIQFRTRLQHLWAMAVETVGMFYGHALKSSLGDQGWLDFFKLASAAISHLEKAPVVAEHADKSFEEIRLELERQGNEHSFFTKLAAIKEIDEKDSAEEYDYWLLELNLKRGKTAVFGFKSDQIETAHEMYTAKEQTPACLRGDTQVVLVSTQSFKDLREAYPSYFLDVADFITILHDICRTTP